MKKSLVLLCSVLLLAGCNRENAKGYFGWAGGISREAKVESGRNQWYSYAYFFDKYAAIQATAKQITELKDELSKEDLLALKMNVIRWVEEYNADALKTEDMARFKDEGLPDFITMESLGAPW